MKIVVNKTLHGIYACGKLIIPGTNCFENFDDEDFCVKSFVEDGSLEIKEPSKMNSKEKDSIIENTNTQKTLEALSSMPEFKDVDTKKRRQKLDDFDKAVKEADGNK